jgi:hypothetical protein
MVVRKACLCTVVLYTYEDYGGEEGLSVYCSLVYL